MPEITTTINEVEIGNGESFVVFMFCDIDKGVVSEGKTI